MIKINDEEYIKFPLGQVLNTIFNFCFNNLLMLLMRKTILSVYSFLVK